MNIKPENWEKLTDTEYRHALAMAQFKRFVPFQISALRKERGWSQHELAERSGLTQGVISRAEDPDNGNLAANTILRIANGFDVVFIGQFVSYSQFDKWRKSLSEDAVPKVFEEENEYFKSLSAEPSDQKGALIMVSCFQPSNTNPKAIFIDTKQPTPDSQIQRQLLLPLSTPLGPDVGLRLIGKSTNEPDNSNRLVKQIKNSPADKAMPPIAVTA